jgi:hypothetical protein
MKLEEAIQWVSEEAKKLIDKSVVKAFDGTKLFRPDGSGNYNAMWTRDFCYMLEGLPGYISHEDAVRAYLLIMNRQRGDGTVPDRVDLDGRPKYIVEIGHATKPPTDNAQFAVKIVWEIWHSYKDIEPFINTAQMLERALNSIPLSRRNLVWIDPMAPHSSYGFTDMIAKTGEELYSSLLLYESHIKMAELYQEAGKLEMVRPHLEKANLVRGSLEELWSGKGFFLAASQDCRQPDVWGSAYSVWIRAVDDERALEISRWICKNFGQIVRWGQVRHLPEPCSWERTLTYVKPGTYQNGAYWGTASAWVAYAISITEPQLAEKMIVDLVEFCKSEGKAWECVNAGYRKCPDYVATLACPAALNYRLKV